MTAATKVKIVAAIAILAGPYLTYLGHKEKGRLAELDKSGVTVAGESHSVGTVLAEDVSQHG